VLIISYDFKRLENDGMTPIETAGMLGNAYTESAGTFSPSEWQIGESPPCSWSRDDGSCGIGIFQYTYGGPYDSWVPLTSILGTAVGGGASWVVVKGDGGKP
jgi:hypothetical protein